MIIRYRPLPTILPSCAQIQVVHPRRPVVNNVKRIVYVVSDDFVVGLVRGEFDISVSCLLLQAPTLYLLIQGWHRRLCGLWLFRRTLAPGINIISRDVLGTLQSPVGISTDGKTTSPSVSNDRAVAVTGRGRKCCL